MIIRPALLNPRALEPLPYHGNQVSELNPTTVSTSSANASVGGVFGVRYGFAHFDEAQDRGEIVFKVGARFSAQPLTLAATTMTVYPIYENWDIATLTWNTMPALPVNRIIEFANWTGLDGVSAAGQAYFAPRIVIEGGTCYGLAFTIESIYSGVAFFTTDLLFTSIIK